MSAIDNLNEYEHLKQAYNKRRVEYATKHIDENCNYDKAFKYNVEILDTYDFSDFINNVNSGVSIEYLIDAIEEAYDNEFCSKYGIFVFDSLDRYDITEYFTSRYEVWFEEYTDWVVNRENGAYSQVARRPAYCNRTIQE